MLDKCIRNLGLGPLSAFCTRPYRTFMYPRGKSHGSNAQKQSVQMNGNLWINLAGHRHASSHLVHAPTITSATCPACQGMRHP